MSPYMRSSGLNGLRFNHRHAQAERERAKARAELRESDRMLLERVRGYYVEGALPRCAQLGLYVAEDYQSQEVSVFHAETKRRIGSVDFWSVRHAE